MRIELAPDEQVARAPIVTWMRSRPWSFYTAVTVACVAFAVAAYVTWSAGRKRARRCKRN